MADSSEPEPKRVKLTPEMKAIVMTQTGGPEVLTLGNTAAPTAGVGQIAVKIAYSGINFIDTYHRTGLYKVAFPFIPGREASGVVEALGDDVKDFKVGDRVCFCNPGSYSEQTVLSAKRAIKVPDNLSLELAAAAPLQGLTAHYLVTGTYAVKQDDWVLVHAGAGGTGRLIIQMAKLKGAKVITTVSTQEKAAVAKAAGADHIIMYTENDFQPEVMKLTGGLGVHVVYDGVGKSTYQGSMLSVRKRGYCVLFGNASGAVPPIDPLRLTKLGSIFLTRPTMLDYIVGDELHERANELMGWLAAGQLTLKVAKVFPLAEADKAHTFLQSRAALGKVLLEVNSSL